MSVPSNTLFNHWYGKDPWKLQGNGVGGQPLEEIGGRRKLPGAAPVVLGQLRGAGSCGRAAVAGSLTPGKLTHS